MSEDRYGPYTDEVSAPSTRARAVAPHDANELPLIPKALYVGVAGNITMRGVDDVTDTLWVGVVAGSIIPFRAKFVRATGTTASGILAMC